MDVSNSPTAIILAGGFGTRLREAVPDLPKPLAPVAGRPFLSYLIGQLTSQGIRRIVLSTGYMAERIEAEIGDGTALSARISYVRESEPLGTGGAAALAARSAEGAQSFLVMNGDSYCDVDFDALLAKTHELRERAANPARAVVAVRQVEDVSRYGAVEMDEATGAITAFREKDAAEQKSGWINAGIYVLSPEVLAGIPPGRAVSIEREVFPSLVGAGIFGFKTTGRIFIDIGIPSEFARAQTLLAGLS